MGTGELLEMQGVSKRYRRGDETVVALDRVDLRVSAGEVCALVGRSGAGKSTLLNLAGGLDRPEDGVVSLEGVDVASMGAADRARVRRRRIGFIFQFFHLVPTLTVADNVALPLVLDRTRGARARAVEVLEQVGLGHRGGHFPAELSGGEMQRAAIARALVARPALLLADEPTGNLDTATGRTILDLLTKQVADHGAGLLMVTHDRALAGRADRVVTLEDGRLS